jgi:hypothetical protein
MNDPTPKYFDDDGTEISPDLIPFPKPGLCITCKKDRLLEDSMSLKGWRIE